MPSGKASTRFWDTSRSVSESRQAISSGRCSNLFSDTSRQSRFFMLPSSCEDWGNKYIRFRVVRAPLPRNKLSSCVCEKPVMCRKPKYQLKCLSYRECFLTPDPLKPSGNKSDLIRAFREHFTAGNSISWFPSSHRSFKLTRHPIVSGWKKSVSHRSEKWTSRCRSPVRAGMRSLCKIFAGWHSHSPAVRLGTLLKVSA